jgi:hypothetical protein
MIVSMVTSRDTSPDRRTDNVPAQETIMPATAARAKHHQAGHLLVETGAALDTGTGRCRVGR